MHMFACISVFVRTFFKNGLQELYLVTTYVKKGENGSASASILEEHSRPKTETQTSHCGWVWKVRNGEDGTARKTTTVLRET